MTKSSAPPEHEPLHSVHTTTFPFLLRELGCSVLVTTYQAGRLIVLREDGGVLNTHFRIFRKPMGLAASPRRFALGTTREVQEYVNISAVARKLAPPERYDACYLPRHVHTTGDIDIHEMAWDRDGALWCVNTRFSCLCTLDRENSFVPRWRPDFVSALAPEDRCHLSGLAMVNGHPRYVTALGATDTVHGWRAGKADGGVLVDLQDGRTIAHGLSMPHSPRWHGHRLWVLESGEGALATVDPVSGALQVVAELPGFTRGLDFCGRFAFIGLSQVRESALFSGIPITQRLTERTCGVWVVDVSNGDVVGFLRFEAAVQEIFAVQVLPGIRLPEILEADDVLIATSYTVPDEALKDVALPINLAD